MPVPIYVVDAFADRPFAAIPPPSARSTGRGRDDWLRTLAMEMNLSETAFLLAGSRPVSAALAGRGVEVDLCGHATLAALTCCG